MKPKPLDLPPDVAPAFVEDMRAYFAEPGTSNRDLKTAAISAR
jgi:hypothetical protein